MKFPKFLFLIITVILPIISFSDQALFETHCGSCHIPPGQPRQAPPPFAIQRMLKNQFSDRDAFIEHLVAWAANPTEDKALMKHAVEKFGVMPKPNVSEDDVIKIAAYLYDNPFEKPHHQQMKHQ